MNSKENQQNNDLLVSIEDLLVPDEQQV